MKVLFLTNLNRAITVEHIFTKNVLGELCNHFNDGENEIALATIFQYDDHAESKIVTDKYNDKTYYKLSYSSLLSEEEKIAEIAQFFLYISPTIIHSNMAEAIDVAAARDCGIPIVLTIHIGGIICPRSEVHGFMKSDDSICDSMVGPHCLNCCSMDLPLPKFSYFLYRILPDRLLAWCYRKIEGKSVFYITQFLASFNEVIRRKKYIEIFKYATIIAANKRLKELLAVNGLTDNVVLLPHGVEPRPKLPFPKVQEVVKFYYVGRIQYAKGLHNLLKALEGIDNSLYELHIIGNSSTSYRERRYMAKLNRLAKKRKVVFHGGIKNNKLESIIKDMHVMIHPAIWLEVYGLTIAESLSMGRPVLATRCGGAEMQIKDGVNGWLVEPNNVSSLRDKITEIVKEREKLSSLSVNCALPHSISEYCNHLIDLYKERC